ncbi:23S rRNA (uracil(1939)-C(5))-methyltransferase RlmD [soil metagenome]
MSKEYKIGDEIEVRVEKIVPRGLGIAFAEKLTVFTPLAAPGDLLKVRLAEVKKRLAFARILEVKEAGPERVAPPCEYFGTCGGCDFQQMSYAEQLASKIAIIRDCFARIGKIEFDGDIAMIASPEPLKYRSRARWHVDREKKAIGYYRRDSHDVIDVKTCPILTPELEATLQNYRETLDWDLLWEDLAEIEAASGDGGEVSVYSRHMAEPTVNITQTVNGESYAFSAETFFQGNKSLIGKLIETAIGGASGGAAFDLYCGVGLFTIPMARQFENVVAVEDSTAAIRFARRNMANAKLQNVRLVDMGVGRFLGENQKKGLDLVLIDPPRAGTEKRTIPAIAALKPAEISYVSCEPSILARDLRLLIDAGYKIASVTAIDLFPQTHHVETVVRLTRA